MGKNKGPILQTLPRAQGGSIGHQGEVPNGPHAFDRGAVLEGQGPLPSQAVRLHGMDQAGELLSRIGDSTGPPP